MTGRPQNFSMLVVEDNQADIRLVQEAIRVHRVPVELEFIHDGEKAIDYIEETARDSNLRCPEIVLLDLNLPKRSGKDVLSLLRRLPRWQHVPVVIMTSSDLSRDRLDTERLGANFYFRKPADFVEFLTIGATLNRILADSISYSV